MVAGMVAVAKRVAKRITHKTFARIVHDVMRVKQPNLIIMSSRFNAFLRSLCMTPAMMYKIIGGRAAYRRHWQLEGPR